MALPLRVQEIICRDMKVITHLHKLPKLRMHGATPLPHVFIVFCSPNTNSKTVHNASGTSTKIALLTLTETERGDNGVQALTRVSH
jgi:hypothetical protein